MILQKQFNGVEVDFEPFVKSKNVMVNATQMAKVFGKDVYDFLKNDNSKNFIAECFKTDNSRFLGIQSMDDLIISKQKNGTWMHRVLALKFAAWLNPAFELWVYRTIDEILFGELVETEASIEKTVSLQNEISNLLAKQNKTGDDFEKYLNLTQELKMERSNRREITKKRFEQVYDLFNQPSNPNNN